MAIGNPIELSPNVATKNISSIATAAQTEFTVTGGYRINEIAVYRNGVRLVDGRDFSATDGNKVNLVSPATVDDIIEFVIFDSFDVAGTIVSAASSQNLNGDLNVTGNFYAGIFEPGQIKAGVVTASNLFHVGTALTAYAAGDIRTIGIITAASFSGDGTNLTGVVGVGTLNVRTNTLTVSGVSTFTGALNATSVVSSGAVSGTTGTFSGAVSGTTGTFSGAVNVDATTDSTSTSTGALIVDGGLGVAKNVYIGAGLSVAGTLTYEDVTSVDSVGLITAKSGVNITGGQLQVGAAYSVGNAGVVTAQNVTISAGTIDLKNSGSVSNIKFYCESSNAHYTALQSAAHSAYSGNVTLTLPVTTDTLVARTTTDTLTNKTLTSPSISGPTVTGDLSIADKIIHTGDTNTAIRFPAADTFAVETSGNEALRVDSDGRLLISVTSTSGASFGSTPLALFESSTTNNYGRLGLIYNGADQHASAITFGKSRGTSDGSNTVVQDGDQIGSLFFHGADGTDKESRAAAIMAFVDGTPGSNDMPGRLTFLTTADGAASATERLRITSGGAVHLDYGNPIGSSTLILDKNGSGEAAVRFYNAGSNTAQIALDSTEELTFDVNGGERLRIDSSGYVGINTTNPLRYLHIVGNDGATGTSPGNSDTQLVIDNKGGNGSIIEFLNDTNGSGYLLWTDTDASNRGLLQYNHSTNAMTFGTNAGTTALTLDSSQNASFVGSVSDSKGDVRQIIYQNKTSGYVLVAADAGKCIHISTGGVTINNSIFSAGDAVTIVNNSGSTQTITQGSGVTLYDTGDDGSTGNKTLKARGMATVWFSSASVGYITGNFD